MRKHFVNATVTFLALLVSSSVTLAQTYGTKAYAPGAWKPDELPPAVSQPKPFNPHDLSGVWSMPTKTNFERHSLNDKRLNIQDKSIPGEMRAQSYSPSHDRLGKSKIRSHQGRVTAPIRSPRNGERPRFDLRPIGLSPRPLGSESAAL